MRLKTLLSDIKYTDVTGEDREIAALTADSRTCGENSLFVCIKGSRVDGHEYAEKAVQKGATAVVTERVLCLPSDVAQIIVKDSREAAGLLAAAFYLHPSKRLKVIGITGTNGKTTTSYMLASVLEKAGYRVGVIGTLGIRYAGKTYPSELTTPDPIELQKRLADMLLHNIEYVVMEVSAHAIFYKKVVGVNFIACIFTNLTQDHLDFFGTMERYRKTKLQLFSVCNAPIAVLNGDDETGREIARLREVEGGGKTVFYGMNTPSEAFAVVTKESLTGSEGMLNVNDKLCRISLRMTGVHNVYNALGAAACAAELGVSMEHIGEGLNALKGVDGRLERVGVFSGAEIYVDFAHTPDGLEKSLNTLKRHCKGRMVCLFGCGGNRDKSKRALMGETSAKYSDFSVLTSDNPRYEDPLDILSEIEKGYRRFSTRYVVVPDRKRAIVYATEMLQDGDVLLVAGKGGESYQEIMGIKYPFNDKAIIEKLLKAKETTR